MARTHPARNHVVVGWPRLSMVFIVACRAGPTPFPPIPPKDAAPFDAGADVSDASHAPDVIDGSTLVTIASGLMRPIGLAVDGKDVFWIGGDGTVNKCMVIGCSGGAPMRLATGQAGATFIAVDALFAYWMSAQQVVKCAKVGCQDSPTQMTGLTGTPDEIAVDTDTVYFSQAQWGVSKCPLDGGVAVSLVGGGQAFAIDTTNVYVGLYNQVAFCSLLGCNNSPTALANKETLVGSVAVDATDVYWVSSGNIRECAKGGCALAPTTVASSQNGPTSIVVDDSNVYWANYNSGELMRCAKTGCASPTVLVSGLDHPISVALDSASVYWTNEGANNTSTGSVMSLTPK